MNGTKLTSILFGGERGSLVINQSREWNQFHAPRARVENRGRVAAVRVGDLKEKGGKVRDMSTAEANQEKNTDAVRSKKFTEAGVVLVAGQGEWREEIRISPQEKERAGAWVKRLAVTGEEAGVPSQDIDKRLEKS